MITHTFFDKCNTIIENSEYNTGLNPVAELNVGKTLSRILLHFDLSKIREMVEKDGIDTTNLRHVIKMTNCGTVNLPLFNNELFIDCGTKTRAASFDIIAFRLPFPWDEGRGFDYHGDYVKNSHKVISTDCSNWFKARNDMEWDEDGVYSRETLANDYKNNFGISDDAIIIGRQHFDNGTENLELDITHYINKVLNNQEEFNGIGLAFSPRYEEETVEDKFISFFTHHTNTFFAPCLETVNSNVILDDRAKFHIGSKNRLYFFVTDNGQYINLDETPTCTIDEINYDVKHAGKGIYYAEITIKNGEVEPNTILYDTWSNIVLNGEKIDDVEMEFVVLPMEKRFNFGKLNNISTEYIPQLSGIAIKEKMKNNDIREVIVDFIEEYSHGVKVVPAKAEYRLYVRENDREINIFDYQPIERRYDEHSFIIDTNQLIPNDYHIDIKVEHGRSTKIFENVLEFTIVSNVTNFYK
jgi:hypothetical protein